MHGGFTSMIKALLRTTLTSVFCSEVPQSILIQIYPQFSFLCRQYGLLVKQVVSDARVLAAHGSLLLDEQQLQLVQRLVLSPGDTEEGEDCSHQRGGGGQEHHSTHAQAADEDGECLQWRNIFIYPSITVTLTFICASTNVVRDIWDIATPRLLFFCVKIDDMRMKDAGPTPRP